MSADTPTPIDPADIQPGDVVPAYLLKATKSVLADRERELLNLKGPCSSEHCILHYAHVGPCDIHRPDPDAEAVEAIRAAMVAGPSDTSGLPYVRNILQELREHGWDVTRRQS